MHPLDEIDAAVRLIQSRKLPLAVLQCTSAYPCPPERVGLNMVSQLRERYACAVGLSDHSGTIYAGLAAATLGIEVLEVHVTFSREMFGPDVPASVTTDELRQLVEGIRFIERMKANPVDKERLAEELSPLRTLFGKSLVARVSLPAGIALQREHLAIKKPGQGIPAARLTDVLNRRLKRPLAADCPLVDEDLEG
jgi:N-acetylneuraminate synthase